ncbi:phage terminase large subunit [Candidatus Sneabacter namystus]|uniref:Phage terminase large subunit n=1 Tax=Candidatus Sneabacter namystus TaxID=2601646 RepID=A0A5C0UHF0_9RICK|nr:phage terminase large subunit [Candidatus Sneabacter namystus]QEK39538.1 phage terminase large subunit [Candidatus Sneabacter namystus]
MQLTRHKSLLKAIIKNDLSSFIHKVFTTINPGSEFFPNWHISLLAEYLEQLFTSTNRRLIVNVPPRSLKSVCISVAWPAWLLGHDPSKRIIIASYCDALSVKHSLDCRIVMSSAWYKKAFPDTVLGGTNTKRKFTTTQNGFRMATSTGGYLTGEGADVLIIDDPHNPTYIHSEHARGKLIQWYRNTFATRLNNPSKGVIVLVMQRLHKEDLSGYLMKSNMWDLLKIPSVADQDYIYQRGKVSYVFKKNEIINKHYWSYDHIRKIQKDIGNDAFFAQYMQSPVEDTFRLINKTDIFFYDEEIKQYDLLLQSWDTAIKVNADSDFSVCSTWKIRNGIMYLVDIYRDKLEYPELKEAIISLQEAFSSDVVLIEDHGSGQSIIQDLKSCCLMNIEAIRCKTDKVHRMITTLPLFRSQKVLLPKNKTFVHDLVLPELLNFPKSKYDDIVDSLSQAINYFKSTRRANEMKIRVL